MCFFTYRLDNDQRPHSCTATIMRIVKLLVIVIVTVAVTLLCIRSGQAMAKTAVLARTIYQVTDSKPEAQDHDKISVVTADNLAGAINTVTPSTILENTVTHNTTFTDNVLNTTNSIGLTSNLTLSKPERNVTSLQALDHRKGVQTVVQKNTTPEPMTTMVDEEQSDHLVSVEHAQASSRSLGTFGHIAVGPPKTRNRDSPIVIRGKLMKTVPLPLIHRDENSRSVEVDGDNDDIGDGDINDANIVVDAGLYRVDNR